MKLFAGLSRVIGFLAACAMHGVLITVMVWEPTRRVHIPEVQGPGASASASRPADASGATMVLIQINQPTRDKIAEELTSNGVAPSNMIVQILSPDAAPAFDFSEAIERGMEEVNAADLAESAAVRAMYFGRYTKQIDARILRAWRRPRSPINADQPDEGFHCDVRITQDSQGYVQEIQFVACNGSAAWQMSLAAAIDRASPLPAPPRPSVFSNVLSMTFQAEAYGAGRAEDEYETGYESLTQRR